MWVVRYWETAQPTEVELLAVMKHLRFAAMDAGFVQTMVQAWPGLESKAGLARIVLDSALSAGHALPRWGFGPRLVYILGGSNVSEEGLSTVDVYDPLTDAWKQLASMPAGRHLHAGAALDGNIYIMGGQPNPDVVYDDGGDISLSTADVYNPRTDCWHRLANMARARTNLAAAAADGRIYAIGGESDEGETVATVEAFDPLLGAWSEVASMSFSRYNHAAAVVDGKIYAIGGIGSEGESIDSVEMYDPLVDSWQQVASMPKPRFRHAAAVMDGMILVSGGYIDDFMSTAVAVFDPQTNTWTSEVASMGTARRDHASAVIGGKVYAFGGFLDEPDGSTASVEAYNPISNTWAQVLDLTAARDDFVALAL